MPLTALTTIFVIHQAKPVLDEDCLREEDMEDFSQNIMIYIIISTILIAAVGVY